MFGSKEKLSKEELLSLQQSAEKGNQLAEHLLVNNENINSDFQAMEDSHKEMEDYIHQAMENVEHVRDYSTENIESVAGLSHRMDELFDNLRHFESDYDKILERLRQVEADSQSAVEQHKHFTTPSKNLSEIPEGLYAQNKAYLEQLDHMQEYSKQMGVLSLNAAIEAGRMGEAGRSFVSAAEEVRNLARDSEKEVQEMRLALQESDKKIRGLEDTIATLVKLLKDNNVAVTKLMRSVGETRKFAEGCTEGGFSQEVSEIKSELIGVRNLEEEIVKAEERNHMQLEDVVTELGNYNTNRKEVLEAWEQAFILIEQYK